MVVRASDRGDFLVPNCFHFDTLGWLSRWRGSIQEVVERIGRLFNHWSPMRPVSAIATTFVSFVDIQAHVFTRCFHVLVSVFGCWFRHLTTAARLPFREQPAFPGTSTYFFSLRVSHAAIVSGR